MREIKFRGKRVDNGEWVYGLPVNYCNKTYILVLTDFEEERVYEQYPHKEMRPYEVIPETVGQSTGMKDKYGVEIYDGDIVNNEVLVRHSTGQERWYGDVGVVRYDTKNGCLVIDNRGSRTKRLTAKVIKNNRVQVIDNIHDNPELVGKKK